MNSNKPGVKETATIIWTVPGFSNQNGKDCSPDIFTESKNYQFLLRLDSKSKLFAGNCGDFVYIYLWTQNKNSGSFLPVQYRISILDNVGQKQLTRDYKYAFKDANNRNVTFYVQSHECVPFLVNDTLKLHCEIDILNESKMIIIPPRPQLLEDSSTKTCQDYRALLESGKLADFVIVVGGKKLSVHKAILAARSAVFAAMFEHSETKEVKEGQVTIKDSDMAVEVCELLIRYIYCGDIEMLDKYAAELFEAADMYQLDHLKSICEQSLIASIETESVCSVVMLADLHNVAGLKSKCIQFMIDNYEQVMGTDGWKQLMATNRMDLLAELFKISVSLTK